VRVFYCDHFVIGFPWSPELVERGLRRALATAPDLAFYVAGADPWAGDRLGRLSVSRDGMARRDRLVFELTGAAGVPVAVVMSGGYAERVEDTVELHLRSVRGAALRTAAGRAA